MTSRSRNANVDSVGSNPERILRGSPTSANVGTPLQDLEIGGRLSAIRVTNLGENATD